MPRHVDEFVPLGRAAEIAGVNRETLRRLARDGIIECSRMPWTKRQDRLFKTRDMERLRQEIEAGFQAGNGNAKRN